MFASATDHGINAPPHHFENMFKVKVLLPWTYPITNFTLPIIPSGAGLDGARTGGMDVFTLQCNGSFNFNSK